MTTPEKPHPDFPLTPRADGRWCKRVNRKLYIFSGTAQEALDEWLRVKDHLIANRKPPPKGKQYLTVGDAANAFLTWKKRVQDSGELAPRTYRRYYDTCAMLTRSLGVKTPIDSLTPRDFEALREQMAKRWKKIALGVEIGYVRSIFKYAKDSGLIDREMNFGPGFARPKKKHLREEQRAIGPRLFSPAEIRKAIKAASVNVRAMILLGINCALGNTDIATMPQSAVDLESGWLDYPRTKTGVERRVPLWPETVAALRAALKKRTEPKDSKSATLLFIAPHGRSYEDKHKGTKIAKQFRRIAKSLGISRTFYDLRRSFQTIGEESGDVVAVSFIMGHAPSSGDMASTYRQVVTEGRLRRVVDHVRTWLFNSKEKPPSKASRRSAKRVGKTRR